MGANDDTLGRRLASGDRQAFAALYAEHGADLFAYLVTLTGRRQVAEDVLQAVWLRLVRYRRRLAKVERLRAYLFTTARNEARRLRSRPDAPAGLEEPDGLPAPSPSPSPADDERLRRAVERLRRERREVVALKAWHGLTFAEIATVLAISPNTAASRYRLALEDLASMLRENTHVAG